MIVKHWGWCVVCLGSFAIRRPRKPNSQCRLRIIITTTITRLSSRRHRPPVACLHHRPPPSSAPRRPRPPATRSVASSVFRSRLWPPCRCRRPVRRRSVRPGPVPSDCPPAPGPSRQVNERVTMITVRVTYTNAAVITSHRRK